MERRLFQKSGIKEKKHPDFDEYIRQDFRNALVCANYRNAVKGIDYRPEYLERFFRNLLLGEQWDLRNRYLHINASGEWKNQPNLAFTTSTPQVPHKYPTS